MSKGLVLVTGANGYIGGHIINELLKEGWSVRALCRTGEGRVEYIKASFPEAGERLETFEVADILEGDFAAAVKGVDVVIHTASPPLSVPADVIIRKNVDASLNLFKVAIAAGVKKLVYTSGHVALSDLSRAMSDDVITDADWADITLDKINTTDISPFTAYMHAKTVTEKEFWKLADEHPDVDFVAILPTTALGARIPNPSAPLKRERLSTMNFIIQLLDRKTYPPIPFGHYIHVRDIAEAHVAALNPSFPKTLPDNRRKRFILSSPVVVTWKEATEIIRKARPQLDERLPPKDAEGAMPQTKAKFDTSLTEEVLGVKEYRGVEEILVDTVDYVLEWEKAIKKGEE